jgi:hypothetical protein
VAAWDSLLEKWSKPLLVAFGENDPVLGPGTGAQAVWQRCSAPRRGEGERRAREERLEARRGPCTTRGAGTNFRAGQRRDSSVQDGRGVRLAEALL